MRGFVTGTITCLFIKLPLLLLIATLSSEVSSNSRLTAVFSTVLIFKCKTTFVCMFRMDKIGKTRRMKVCNVYPDVLQSTQYLSLIKN